MKTASFIDFANQFAEISRWIEEGESVEITRNGQPFAHLTPASEAETKKVKFPDVLKRMDSYMDFTLPSGTLDSIIDYDRGDR